MANTHYKLELPEDLYTALHQAFMRQTAEKLEKLDKAQLAVKLMTHGMKLLMQRPVSAAIVDSPARGQKSVVIKKAKNGKFFASMQNFAAEYNYRSSAVAMRASLAVGLGQAQT